MVQALMRTCVLYFAVIIALRVMGKRQIGELEPSELAVTVLISELAAIPMQDMEKPLLNGIVPIAGLVGLEILLSALLLKSSRARSLLEGKPVLVVSGGKIVQAALRRHRLTTDELLEALRIQGVTDLSSVRHAILETNGQLSVILYEKCRPVTAGQMNAAARETGLPVVLISDGRVKTKNLEGAGLDAAWLARQLKTRGAASAGEVFLMTRDEAGEIYFLKKE